MKKVALGLLFSSVLLVGCKAEEVTKDSSETIYSTTATFESSEEPITTTFKDGTLITEDFQLKFKDVQIIKSPSENGYGLYVTFDLTNNSDSNIVPFDILETIMQAKQTNETSLVELDSTYYELDAFGDEDDTDTYNEQVDKSNALENELLPDKTVEVFQVYSLDNLDSNVEISAIIDNEELEGISIEISELEKPVIEESYEEDTSVYQNEESQDNYEYTIEGESTTLYFQAINEGATENQALMYGYGWVENWQDAPLYEENAVQEAETFAEEFEEEHGRAPSSGETQLQWLEENGLLDEE